MKIDTLILSAIVLICIKNVNSIKSVFVTIRNGTLEGLTMNTRKGREIAAFKSIPYALPPIGLLRFEAPQPSTPWEGIKSAKEDVPICFQANNEVFNISPANRMSEDCLYLNVYTPKLDYNDCSKESKKYPVMVWIHGGGFYSGTSHSHLYGPKFLLDRDIVLVTMNYRLESLGFLSTVDNAAYGNYGLKDQIQSLRWVQENIGAFGGDPDSVTIFGESAGAVSVHQLMMSPLTKGLFHRAISQSGTSLSPWGMHTQKSARLQAFRLGASLNCTSKYSYELVQCLRTKNPQELIDAAQHWSLTDSVPKPYFRPVVEPQHENAVLVEDPIDTIQGGRSADIPWLNGVNKHEGALAVAMIFGMNGGSLVPILDKQFVQIAPQTLIFSESCPAELHEPVARAIRNYYFGNKSIDEGTRFNLIHLDTEAYFTYGHAVAIKESFRHFKNPIYYYQLDYQSDWSWSVPLGDSKRHYGVCHADDLQYFFPIREVKEPLKVYSEQDYKMVDILTNLWSNFAATGSPTLTGETNSIRWRPVRSARLEQLQIKSPTDIKMVRNLRRSALNFWAMLPCPAGLAPRSIA